MFLRLCSKKRYSKARIEAKWYKCACQCMYVCVYWPHSELVVAPMTMLEMVTVDKNTVYIYKSLWSIQRGKIFRKEIIPLDLMQPMTMSLISLYLIYLLSLLEKRNIDECKCFPLFQSRQNTKLTIGTYLQQH